MSPSQQTKISKRLSLVLRHAPESIGITLDENGWSCTDALIIKLRITAEILETIVTQNPKKRFEFNHNKTQIRARQGHSVSVDLGYTPQTPPEKLYHGTPERFLKPILEQGLKKQNRHHVHLSTDIPLMLEVARRRGAPTLLEVDSQAMHKLGHQFYLTENQVWLTDNVPAAHLKHITNY